MRFIGYFLIRRLFSCSSEPIQKRADLHLFEASDAATLVQVSSCVVF